MSQAEQAVRSARQSRWRRVVLLTVGLAPVVAALAGWAYLQSTARVGLRGAVGEADRLDPGWRLWEIDQKRAVIPPGENSADTVVAAFDRIPMAWMAAPADPQARKAAAEAEIPRGDRLHRLLMEGESGKPLDPNTLAGLRAEMTDVGPALEIARTLADKSRGRYKLVYGPMIFDTFLTHVQNSRRVATLLQLDAIFRAEEGDIDGALDSSRAVVGVARSIGDEPFLVSQLVRMAEDAIAIRCLQRALARGEASDAALARIQAVLADEAEQPLLLHGVRGERACYYESLDRVARGEVSGASMARIAGGGGALFQFNVPIFYRYNQALGLRHLNRSVEIAKRPLPEQAALWSAWEADVRPPQAMVARFSGALAALLLPAISSVAVAQQRSTGMLRVAATLAAVERYRLAENHWPDRLDQLVPRFLPKVPEDPYTGGPIRLARRDGDLLLYVTGPDRQDDGGQLDPKFRGQPGTDFGLRLGGPGDRTGAEKNVTTDGHR